jgi:type II secretion system protein G
MKATLERLRRRREEEGREGGFTLIELLIVIVILAILAAIVVFAVQNLTGQSAKAACSSDYKTTETALEAYKAQMGSYPTALSALGSTATDPAGNTVGPWLKDIPPTSSASGEHYWFDYSGGGSADYTIYVQQGSVASPQTSTAGLGGCSTIS